MFSDEESIEPFQRYVGKQSHFSNSRQYLASILPIVLTISVVATSLVVEARYYHQRRFTVAAGLLMCFFRPGHTSTFGLFSIFGR